MHCANSHPPVTQIMRVSSKFKEGRMMTKQSKLPKNPDLTHLDSGGGELFFRLVRPCGRDMLGI